MSEALGSRPTPETPSGSTGINSSEACVDFCHARCGNCRFVSFSEKLGDCSRYASCNMSALEQLGRKLGRKDDVMTRAVTSKVPYGVLPGTLRPVAI